jgi:hypothetical protein
MAFYIDLDKIEHNENFVRYKYYDAPDNVGIIELNFVEDKFKEIKPAPRDPNGLLFERAAMKLVKLKRHGNFPDKTYWAS